MGKIGGMIWATLFRCSGLEGGTQTVIPTLKARGFPSGGGQSQAGERP